MVNLNTVRRVEVIGPEGRQFVAYVEPGVSMDVQDDGRTLKIFVGNESDRDSPW